MPSEEDRPDVPPPLIGKGRRAYSFCQIQALLCLHLRISISIPQCTSKLRGGLIRRETGAEHASHGPLGTKRVGYQFSCQSGRM